jgi:DNA helicase IV
VLDNPELAGLLLFCIVVGAVSIFGVRHVRRFRRHFREWEDWRLERRQKFQQRLPIETQKFVGAKGRLKFRKELRAAFGVAKKRLNAFTKGRKLAHLLDELRLELKQFDAALKDGNAYLVETRYAKRMYSRSVKLLGAYDRLLPSFTQKYLTQKQEQELAKMLKDAVRELATAEGNVRETLRAKIGRWDLIQAREEHVMRCKRENRTFCEEQLAKHEGLFDQLESYPLSSEQRSAIVHDDGRALVVAGAGTGKTSTILGKVAWLISAKQARADEILVLAFNRRAAEEVKARLEGASYHGMAVQTFHALGLKVHRESASKGFHLANIAGDVHMLRLFIQDVLEQIALGEDSQLLDRFIVLYRTPLFDETDPVNKTRFLASRLMTLKGERVRSEQERRIADWCTLHGVEYVYEQPYSWPGEGKRRFHYRPDFYFPKIDVWLEHWGVDRNGRTRPGISEAAYARQMESKRQVHRENKTDLLETNSFDFWEGDWERLLQRQLEKAGAQIKERPSQEWLSPEDRIARISELAKLVERFLALFRPSFPLGVKAGDSFDVPEMDATRTRSFLQLFDHILERYEVRLEEEDGIDFAEMIHSAYHAIGESHWSSGYKYVIVDEFQDISRDRARLVQALLEAGPDVRFLGVGDDWQSINRFAGADVTLMTGFEGSFGSFTRTDLTQTYRYPKELLSASKKFVTRNPLQIEKELSASHEAKQKCIKVIPSDRAHVIRTILEWDSSDESVEILWLTRYHATKPDAVATAQAHPKVSEYREETIHATKGEEADFVIIGDLVSEGLGFPSNIEDDPLLTLLQPGGEAFPFGEERRLMYVALTRAKRGVILLHPKGEAPSPFLIELMGEDYQEFVEISPELMEDAGSSCPLCKIGRIQRKKGANDQDFWACSVFPQCDYKPAECPECRDAYLTPNAEEDVLNCVDARCSGRARLCPECRAGALVSRAGGKFLGCNRFPSCNHVDRTSRRQRSSNARRDGETRKSGKSHGRLD